MAVIETRRSLFWLAAFAALSLSGCMDSEPRELGYTVSQRRRVQPIDNRVVEVDYDCPPLPFHSVDDIVSEIASDLAATPRPDRPFYRYLTLADSIDRRICGNQLDRREDALGKIMNSLSMQRAVVAPVALGDDMALLRIDLRAYGWTDTVVIDGIQHADHWEAVASHTPSAVALIGSVASSIAREAHTAVPWLSAEAFIATTTEASVYYALLGIPSTLAGIRQFAGLSPQLDPVRDHAVRTGTMQSRVVRPQGNVHVLDRYVISDGAYWEATQMDAGDFLADPLHIQPEAQRMIMFTLPNHFLAYAVTDADGRRQASGELVLDTNRDDFTGTVLASCTNCHAQGFIPAADQISPIVLRNPELFSEEVVTMYLSAPDDVERARLVTADSDLFEQAMVRAGVPTQGGDALVSVVSEYALDVPLESAAASLFVSPDTLRGWLPSLSPQLRPLGVGLQISRLEFDSLYVEAYCALHADDANPPATVLCD